MQCSVRSTVAFVGMSLLIASCATNPTAGKAELEGIASGLSSEDIAAIRATSERWVNAVKEERWDDAAATYTEDAILWYGEDKFEGRESIRESIRASGPFPPSFDLKIEEVEGRGDVAFASGYATVTPEGGEPVKLGQYLDVRVRQPNGTWLFYRDMVIPPAGGPKLPTLETGPEMEHVTGVVFPPGLPFSEVVRIGGVLYLSGSIGTEPGTEKPGTAKLAPGGIRPEARQAMEHIKTYLEAAGSSMDRIARCTVFLVDLDEWTAFNEVYRSFFEPPYPARTAVGVNELALGARVEVECTAAAG